MTTFPNVRAVAQDAGRERVVVGGVDITGFRATLASDTPTKVPGYQLIEPFAYGASQPLVIPRTNSLFERYGTGDLVWLKKGVRVQYQRVTDDGVVTDYRGVILAIRSSGREWVAEVAGELVGRANLIDKQPVLVRPVKDLGKFMGISMRALGFHFVEPVTGLEAPAEGGLTLLSYMQKLSALSQTHDTAARAAMPDPWGSTTWKWLPKNTTDKDLTLYADGQRIAVDLVDDVSEQPNTIFGSGVTPAGVRWRNARRPGIRQGPPDDYPIAGGAPFGLGTTDADTIDGFGISSMKNKLAWTSLLPDRYATGDVFDSHVVNAVNRLKDEAGLAEDGMMTTAAWAALWNTDVVGYSLEGSRIFPIAQASRVRSLNYSSTGDVIGRNPNHVPGTIRVDRTIDYGVCEKSQAASHARGIIHTTAGHEWAGTITLNGISAFTGEHDETDAASLTAADLMPSKDIRPGMNAWLPYFDGGTLVHISQVDVSGDNVTLTVDTGARDYLDLRMALERNRESKRNIQREWIQANMGGKPSANFVTRDEDFGKLGQNVRLRGGHWNVIEVPMGQSGTVSKTDIRLFDDPTEFCVAVFCREMHEDSMDGFIGNPFNVDGDGLTVWEHEHMDEFFNGKLLRFVYGQGAQPAGYFWRKGYDADGNRTANPLTGSLLDESSWTYFTSPTKDPVVYLCIFPLEDCTLKHGQLFDALEDDAT